MKQRRFQSLTQVVEAYYDELRRFVRHRSGSASLAEDVVQDAWLRARKSTAAPPDNPCAYVYRMARNLMADHMRRRAVRSALHAPSEAGDDIACAAPTPDRIVAARQEWAILEAAIRELPTKRRRVFLLYRREGLTMREIGERLGISQKTVENQIALAMLHCRKRLEEAGLKL